MENDGRVWKRGSGSTRGIQAGEWLSFRASLPSFYGCLGSSPMIKFDECRCVDLIGIFPGVVAFGIALPFDQVL
jgi:hypothetical protein